MCHEVDYRRCSSPAQPFGRIAFSPFGRAGNLNSASIPENRKIALLDSFVRTSFGSELAVFSTGINRAQGARFPAPCCAAISMERTIQKAKLAKIVNALIALTEVF